MAQADPFSDRVLGTTTDLAGTSGNWTLASTTDGHQSLDTVMATGDEKVVTAVGSSGQWECFITKKLGSNSFSRVGDLVISSSTGSVVNFTAGTKEIFIGFPFSEISARDKFDYLLNGHGVINDGATSLTDGVTGAHRAWLALTQTAAIGVSTLSDVADGLDKMIRITQSQAAAQRMGHSQIIRADRCKKLRGKRVSFGGVLRYSNAAAVRFAILEWTGTADAATRDVVNDWTSSTYTAGNFFISSNLTVRAVGSLTPGAATLTDFRLTATLGSTFNNLIVFIWTEGTAAQNSTLDFACQLKRGSVVMPCVWRSLQEELFEVTPFVIASTSIFVRTDGHDSNTGLVGSAAGAKLTLQGAADLIKTMFIAAGVILTVDVENGTYTGGGSVDQCSIVGWSGGGQVRFLGDPTTHSNVILDGNTKHVFKVEDGAMLGGGLIIRGFRMSTGATGACVYGTGQGKIWVEDNDFGSCLIGVITDTFTCDIIYQGTNKILNGATINKFIDADEGGIQCAGTTDIESGVTISGALANFRFGGLLIALITWTGSTPTGKRFSGSEGASCITQTVGLAYFPGTLDGTLSGGADYDGMRHAPIRVFAYNSASDLNVTGNNTAHTCIFDTEVSDVGSNYNNTTGVFTAPAPGGYAVAGSIVVIQSLAAATHIVNIVASNRTTQCGNIQGLSSTVAVVNFAAGAIDMDTGDTFTVTITVNGVGADTADFFGTTDPRSHISITHAG